MTLFYRLLDIHPDAKAEALKRLLTHGAIDVTPEQFRLIPASPFSYWCSRNARRCFEPRPAASLLEGVFGGISTLDDGRFLRLSWEVGSGRRWLPLAKGGEHARYYADIYLRVPLGADDGREISVFRYARRPREGQQHRGHEAFRRPGVTWSLRTQRGLSMRALPVGCIFSHKGPSAFVRNDSTESLLAALAVMNSLPYRYLVAMQMAFGSYEVGVIQRTPFPRLPAGGQAELAQLAVRAWSGKRLLDTHTETSHAFLLPLALLKRLRGFDPKAAEDALEEARARIDELAFHFYDLGGEDRIEIERWGSADGTASLTSPKESEESTEDEHGEGNDDAPPFANDERVTLLSWLVGVSFGRFDLRLATGERSIPPAPEPFDPLPSRSQGMWPEREDPSGVPTVLVDDEGHSDDLRTHVATAATKVGWFESADLRQWLAYEFFPLHIKMYSKSRRKAPIYWQIATSAAGYSVWLYLHAFTKDTLYKVQNDYVAPKLAHEERKLESLRRELGESPKAAERKTLAAQETFVDEIRAFLEEVKRVAPLWNPNLDDGVIINFAPLWRLVPQHKPWQKELKTKWDELAAGKYDWAHLAMHFWPERVVPKCVTDRSLAIAHGLEEVFWVEGTAGKWQQCPVPTRSVDELVRERTSPSVKAALKSLLDAHVVASNGRGRGRRSGTAAATGGNA